MLPPRPKIGITAGRHPISWAPDGTYWAAYASAITTAGGDPVHLGPATLGHATAALDGLQAVLFSGGYDIDLASFPNPPDLAGLSAEEAVRVYHLQPEPRRDAYELPLLREALQRDLPILGICRGCQLLNVGLGGGLILDIATEVRTAIRHQPAFEDGPSSHHSLRVVPGTQLADALPADVTACNSRHHQSVRVDESCMARVAAVCPEDGLVEAIEVPGRRWALGVQWHPEYPSDPEVRAAHAPLFQAFVRAASG